MSGARGVCRFCGLTAEQLDRQDAAFLNAGATRCNQPACVRAFEEEEGRAFRQEYGRRKAEREQRRLLEKARRRQRVVRA